MIICDLLGSDYELAERVRADPICGKDFCDYCGDCLHCYGNDPCYNSSLFGEHGWCVYAEDVDEWRANHPEATAATPAVVSDERQTND